jgi:hypothetical protein
MVKHGTVNALFFFKAQPDIDFRKHVKNKCTQQVTYWGARHQNKICRPISNMTKKKYLRLVD